MPSPNLKLCPFCDWPIPPIVRGDMRNFRQRGRYCRVVCACGAQGPARESEREAIDAWNHSRAAKERHGSGTPDRAGMGVVNGG